MMKTTHTKLVRILLEGIALAILPSCQTVKGVGRDVENAGEGLQRAASR